MAASSPQLAWTLVLAVLPACSSYQWFRSRERLVTDSPEYAPASLYPLRVEPGDEGSNRGAVTVWSRGGRIEDGEGRIHVGFVLHNRSNETWWLEGDVHLRSLVAGMGELQRVDPAEPADAWGVAPGERKRVDLWFEPGFTPRAVQSFDVRWRVRFADGRTYDELTPFTADSLKPWYPYLPTTQFWRDS